MNELATKIQIIINTLGVLNMPPTYDNVNHMTGIYNLLHSIMDEVAKPAEKETDAETGEEAEPDGV